MSFLYPISNYQVSQVVQEYVGHSYNSPYKTDSEQRIGQLLLDALNESYCNLYRVEYKQEKYQHVPSENADPVQVLKWSRCIRINCSSMSGWESSEAVAVLRAIDDSLVPALPGYGDASWTVE